MGNTKVPQAEGTPRFRIATVPGRQVHKCHLFCVHISLLDLGDILLDNGIHNHMTCPWFLGKPHKEY